MHPYPLISIWPRGEECPCSSRSYTVYSISCTDNNLISELGVGPPMDPEELSPILVKELAADVSVYPYPEIIGQQKQIFKKLSTSVDIGADPVSIYLTLPPIISLVLLNTSLSYNVCVNSPESLKFSNFVVIAFSTKPFFHPSTLLKLSFIKSWNLLNRRGTLTNTVGLTTYKSNFSF